jgi:ketosteroid isomerase-like protein
MTNQNGDVQAFLSKWSAAERKGDRGALASLLTEEFVGVGPLGFILSKQAWLDRYDAQGLKYDKFDLEETQIHEYGDAAVVITRLNQTGTAMGQPIPTAARTTLMLVSRNGGKHLAAISLAFIAGTPGAPPMPGRP